ncbi:MULTISPECIES: hypothetical protein [Streptomyces]|jgi:hypothetical protein|nr:MULTISPECIES: hypothetical protein [Streptomyces]
MGRASSLTALSENLGSAMVDPGWSSPTGQGDAAAGRTAVKERVAAG